MFTLDSMAELKDKGGRVDHVTHYTLPASFTSSEASPCWEAYNCKS